MLVALVVMSTARFSHDKEKNETKQICFRFCLTIPRSQVVKRDMIVIIIGREVNHGASESFEEAARCQEGHLRMRARSASVVVAAALADLRTGVTLYVEETHLPLRTFCVRPVNHFQAPNMASCRLFVRFEEDHLFHHKQANISPYTNSFLFLF